MSEFEEALWLSAENWVDSFPTDLPKHKFSKKHNKIINDIIYGKQDKKIKFSKGTIKVLIIAAVLLAIATTVFAIPPSREYIVDKFSNHSEYNVVDKKNSKSVTSLNVNYIPAGFKKSDDYGNTVQYVNGDKEFVVDKIELTASIGFDTEHYDPEIIKINGIDAVYYRSDYNEKGIIFNDGNYIYMIEGNIEKDELVQIAQNVEWLFVKRAESSALFYFFITKWNFLGIMYNEGINRKGGVNYDKAK